MKDRVHSRNLCVIRLLFVFVDMSSLCTRLSIYMIPVLKSLRKGNDLNRNEKDSFICKVDVI